MNSRSLNSSDASYIYSPTSSAPIYGGSHTSVQQNSMPYDLVFQVIEVVYLQFDNKTSDLCARFMAIHEKPQP